MAYACNKFMKRSSISSIKSAIKSNLGGPSIDRSATSNSSRFSLPTSSTSSPLRRFSLNRSPSELGGVQSLLPFHSAVAAARMTSCLGPASRNCRALSQGETSISYLPTYITMLKVEKSSACQFQGDFVSGLSS